MALPVNGSTHLIPAYYSFIDPERMKGWVGWVGWHVADGLPTLEVIHQLQVERRTGKVRQSETDVLPLCHATNTKYVPVIIYCTTNNSTNQQKSRISQATHRRIFKYRVEKKHKLLLKLRSNTTKVFLTNVTYRVKRAYEHYYAVNKHQLRLSGVTSHRQPRQCQKNYSYATA